MGRAWEVGEGASGPRAQSGGATDVRGGAGPLLRHSLTRCAGTVRRWRFDQTSEALSSPKKQWTMQDNQLTSWKQNKLRPCLFSLAKLLPITFCPRFGQMDLNRWNKMGG